MINHSMDSFIQILSKHPENEIKSFWRFYFDGPHPPKQLPKELKQIKAINGEIYVLMVSALKEIQDNWKAHNH